MKTTFVLVAVLAFCVASSFASLTPVNPAKWSYNTGYTYTLYSYAAYCPTNQISSWTCKWCHHNDTVKDFVTTDVIQNNGERVYVGYNPSYQQIVVAFRGSSDLLNWINNIDATQTKYPYCDKCYVHSGFYNTWLSVKDDTIAAMWRVHVKYPKYKIVVTGHSLGGALSTLGSVEVYKNVTGKVPVYSWTLGSPRVGNGKFAHWYEGESGITHSQRMVNWKDEVPHLPPSDVPLDEFRHVTQEVWEQKDVNTFILCSATNGEDSSCSDSLLVSGSISDHLHYFGLEEDCTTQ